MAADNDLDQQHTLHHYLSSVSPAEPPDAAAAAAELPAAAAAAADAPEAAAAAAALPPAEAAAAVAPAPQRRSSWFGLAYINCVASFTT